MTTTPSIEPFPVVEFVEQYVDHEISDRDKYENRQPLDESGVFDLHRMAAEVYALGFNDGERAADARRRARNTRERGASLGSMDTSKFATGGIITPAERVGGAFDPARRR